MADFVAVIRRAVDGLANNTPEMRVRVYDKARSAVQRQLENMKPRPSDDMLRRQLDKLEAAIVEVEAEHAEALPALAVPVAAASLTDEVYEPEPARAPEPEPVASEPVPYAQEAYAEPSAYVEPEPVAVEPAYGAQYDRVEQPALEAAPAEEALPEPVSAIPDYAEPVEEQPLYAEPAYVEPQLAAAGYAMPDYHSPEPDVEPHVEPEPQADRYADEPRYAARAPAPAWPDAPSTAPIVDADPFADDLPSAAYPTDVEPERPAAVRDDVTVAAPAATNAVPDDWFMASDDVERATHDPVHFSESLRRTQELQPELPSAGGWVEPPQTSTPSRTASSASSHDDAAADVFSAHFDDEQHASATAKMPPVADLPEFEAAPPAARPSSFAADDDLLAEFLKPSQAAQQVAPPPQASADPWNDLEELIGYDRNAATSAGAGAAVMAAGAAANVPGDATAQASRLPEHELDDLMAAATPSYRVAPKPKRNYGVLLLALVGVALLGGGGYAIWMNRGALDDVIGDVAGSSAPQTTAPQTPAGTPPVAGAAASAQAPAGASPAAGSSKFTQRLLANGSEVDEGAGGPQVAGAGQSVAQLNVPGDMSQAPAQAGTPAAGAAPGTAPAAPSTTPAATAAVTGEKIFLYEERIGQSSPAAVEGSVSWSLQNEAGANGHAEPVVQGRISVPDRGLTALITFKRNSDASLPASHLVEFVFSLPPGFEGGSIDSVQRISLKQTEQDRGDALIAVPAKITPDFHMIALNDFPDARSRNLELLKGRNWIDVPLVYTTGRRALLTLQKGEAGAKAFNDAIAQWALLPPAQGQ